MDLGGLYHTVSLSQKKRGTRKEQMGKDEKRKRKYFTEVSL